MAISSVDSKAGTNAATGIGTITDANTASDHMKAALKNKDYMEFISLYKEKMRDDIDNGTAEPSFQTGSQTFTDRQWDRLLENFDSAQDDIKKAVKEQGNKLKEEADESRKLSKELNEKILKELLQKQEDDRKLTLLTSELLKAVYPVSPEDAMLGAVPRMYITAVSEDGIRCISQDSEEYDWELLFANSIQYRQAMDIIDWASEEMDNYLFAANENFWQDYLGGNIDIEAFKDFLATTNNGIPDYVIGDEYNMRIDESKIKWAQYMN
ncbi:hypothetical protein NQ488_09735 [[Bacteroides] pectinophilus]|nr:hypothetical protein NQ488_09735 [[Bacteroides] pectinophilus]CDD57386.1 putative uncharacterized protein [Bacteroides pectinophilus CAG:437]HBH93941.1 hypothetical protein [Bacteroides sp.]